METTKQAGDAMTSTSRFSLQPYIKIARPDHWFKNIFMLPGVLLAYILSPIAIKQLLLTGFIGVAATCLIASANYVINEWLDREFDKHHPTKKHRPSVSGQINGTYVYIEYVALALVGLLLAFSLSIIFGIVALSLLVMGFLYNVRPFRTKERIYLDVLSESINNPIRFLLGWFIVTQTLIPPASLLITYWMGGAFLMAVKRLSEYNFINNPEQAGKYRRSFMFYNQQKLLSSILFYALCAAFFGGVFLVKYKIELIFALPFLAFMFVWYFHIGLKPNSIAQNPEHMYKEKGFVLYVLLVVAITLLCLWSNFPALDLLLDKGLIILPPSYG